jgi:hypothetical protein
MRKKKPDQILHWLELQHETVAAWRLKLKEGDERWFPKSQCYLDTTKKTIQVPDWIIKARKDNE